MCASLPWAKTGVCQAQIRATAMASAVLRAEKEELLPIVDLILFCCVFVLCQRYPGRAV
jgi:hypothetical protein